MEFLPPFQFTRCPGRTVTACKTKSGWNGREEWYCQTVTSAVLPAELSA